MLTTNYKIIRQLEEKQDKVSELHLKVLIANRHTIIVLKNKERVIKLIELFIEQHETMEMEKHLEIIFSSYDLKSDFKHVDFLILTNYFINLPSILSTKEGNETLLKFTTELPNGYVVRDDRVLDLSVCYGITIGLKNYIERTFHNAKISSQASVFIDCFLNHTQFSKTNFLINFIGKQMEVAIKKDNKLQLYNLFTYNSNEDALYYILFLVEQFQLSVIQSKFTIIGQLETQDELILSLKKYIKHLNFGVTQTPAQIPNHFYFTQLI
ncbi:MAG: DUF3822 family protein [Bacteroidota bacterium]|jgi:hypothetical protein